jgi:hypothetical protein
MDRPGPDRQRRHGRNADASRAVGKNLPFDLSFSASRGAETPRLIGMRQNHPKIG